MEGPKNITELRQLLAPRAFPRESPGEAPKVHLVQQPSDRMRDTLYEAGRVLYGLVPDGAFQEYVGNVMHDLAIMGESELCRMHGVETEHAPLRLQGMRATDLGMRTLEPSEKPKSKGKAKE